MDKFENCKKNKILDRPRSEAAHRELSRFSRLPTPGLPALNRRERHLYGPGKPLKSKDFLKSIVFSVGIQRFSVDRRAKQRNIYAFLYLVWTGSKFVVTS